MADMGAAKSERNGRETRGDVREERRDDLNS